MKLFINRNSSEILKERIAENKDSFCCGLFFSARWFVLSDIYPNRINVIVLPDRESAEYCASDLYGLVDSERVFFLPENGRGVKKSNYISSISVQRTIALEAILNYKKDSKLPLFIVTYPSALAESLPNDISSRKPIVEFKKGEEINYSSIAEMLLEAGFEKVDFVSEPGQFAVRGAVIDVFSFSNSNPYRISFFGDEIDNISEFNCNTQLSISQVESTSIYSEICVDDSLSTADISSILPSDTLFWLDSADIYIDSPSFGISESYCKVFIDTPLRLKDSVEMIDFGISPQPSFNKNFDLLSADISQKRENGFRVIIFGEKKSQLDRLSSILSSSIPFMMPEFVSGQNIHAGFIDSSSKICCYSDHEIFDRFHRVTIKHTVEKSEMLTVNDLSSFNIGDYIVHIDYGVGIFGGLVRIKDDKGRMHDVVKLMYKDNDVIFISVHSLHKISRYRSKDAEQPRINKLGTKSWQNLKTSAKSRVKDIAKDLIRLYAQRKNEKGFAFSPDCYLQQELESSFIYEDTPDQEKATHAVKMDMEDECPMDRLICGDVGFGKTEVAIRAAFKAVADSKQVAVLVPTTILALQHFNTFKERLENFPCTIDYISRLRTAKEITQIKQRLKEGKIDIIIGTHKLLGKDFEFKDLGLLIIDEEQKFGVSAKEKLRQIKSSVDTLTLTATPIPRTLQFSLLGARDLSIINTPPPNRIPVQTEIILFDKDEIKSIIDYELKRGGQIFFLHNKVEELPAIYEILHRLVPDMNICVAHGQMEPKTLENKIMDFMQGDYDMLLCTTIIENGLDIPNANTIIINQAQNIGLSDLHQLRGRVGRSNRKAFCYLIIPPLSSITDDARRRLKAIEAFSDLGSGFNIAMQDLDIRGAGNLLGAEQSGFITDMGFETYQKILQEAMEELGFESGIKMSSNIESHMTDCTVETDQIALIPDSYIDITAEKIRIYKELDSISSEKELINMKERLQDRFGNIPMELAALFDIVRIRHMAAAEGFEKVIIKNGILIAFFISNPLSPYYKSNTFQKVLEKINLNSSVFEIKQTDGKLKVISRRVNNLSAAYDILKKLQ